MVHNSGFTTLSVVSGMRWAKTSLRNSFFGWLGHDTPAAPAERIEAVRKAMLEALEQSSDAQSIALERKLLFAKDIGELWYARPELMNAVAARVGETLASECLCGITALFDGLQPGAVNRAKPPPPLSSND